MLIRDGDHFVEVLLVERSPPGLPGAGDLRLHVRAGFSTFRGEHDVVWIEASAFRSFLSELRALEERRHGSATLVSMSPEKLHIQFHSTDRSGHMAVSGQFGRWCPAGGQGGAWCQVPFHLVLSCPSRLAPLFEELQSMGDLSQ